MLFQFFNLIHLGQIFLKQYKKSIIKTDKIVLLTSSTADEKIKAVLKNKIIAVVNF